MTPDVGPRPLARRRPGPHLDILGAARHEVPALPREASVHLTETVDGTRRELHLCGPCAGKAGLAPPEPAARARPGGGRRPPDRPARRRAGRRAGRRDLPRLRAPSFMEFRTGGRLGCPNDYEVFARGLLPLLQPAHGATRHVGKAPRRRAPAGRSARLRLRARLREAVAREDYEQAATLRDQLRQKDADR